MQPSKENSISVKTILDVLRLDTGHSTSSFRSVQKKWKKNPYKITTELLKSLENKTEGPQLRINVANFLHRNEKYNRSDKTKSKSKQPMRPIDKMIVDSFLKIITDKKENHELREKIIRGFANGFLLFSAYSQSYKKDVITALNKIAKDGDENESVKKSAKETLGKKEEWIPLKYNSLKEGIKNE